MSKQKQVDVIVDAQNKSRRAFMEVRKDLKDVGDTSKRELGVFNKSFSDSVGSIKKFTDKLGFMDSAVEKAFKGMAASASVYAAASFNDFLKLNDGITQINTLYDQTGKSQEKMYKDSLNMIRLIPTEIDKVTATSYNTISAGADAKYIDMYTRRIGMGAVAGDANMDTVSTAVMGTMNAYKLEVEDLNRVLDLQFTTVKEGIVPYEELATSLGTGVLASAKGAGITLEELQASIALITKNAIPATIATSSLNQLFNKFTDTKVIKEMEKYGVQIQDAKKNTRPLIEIFQDLNKEFDKRGLSSEQRKGIIKDLVGSDQAARAIAPLLGDLKEFDRILKEMGNSDGAMKDAFGDRLESMKTQVKLFWNSLKADGVEQLMTLQPLLDKLMEPFVSKQKLRLDVEEVKDELRLLDEQIEEKNKKLHGKGNTTDARLEIRGLEEQRQSIVERMNELSKEIDSIDTAPIKELKDTLSKSVKELSKLNPPLAYFLDLIGNFALNFVGNEGAENRDKAGDVGKGVLKLYGFKKFIDALDWFNTKFRGKGNQGEGSPLGGGLDKTFSTITIYGNVVTVSGKGGPGSITGNPKIPTNTPKIPGVPKGVGPVGEVIGGAGSVGAGGALAAGAAIAGVSLALIYRDKLKSDKGKRIMKYPENYEFSQTQGKYVSKKKLEKNNDKKKEKDKEDGVTLAPMKGAKLRPIIPKKRQELEKKNDLEEAIKTIHRTKPKNTNSLESKQSYKGLPKDQGLEKSYQSITGLKQSVDSVLKLNNNTLKIHPSGNKDDTSKRELNDKELQAIKKSVDEVKKNTQNNNKTKDLPLYNLNPEQGLKKAEGLGAKTQGKPKDTGSKELQAIKKSVDEVRKNTQKDKKSKELPIFKIMQSGQGLMQSQGLGDSNNVSEVKTSVDLLRNNMTQQLSALNQKESIIDNQIDLQNKIQVDAPKVSTKVYVDGKSIPVQRVEVSGSDIQRQRDLAIRRYGRF